MSQAWVSFHLSEQMQTSTQWGHEMNFSLPMHLGLPERQISCSPRAEPAPSGTLCSASIGRLPLAPISPKEHKAFVSSSRRWNCNKHNMRTRDMPTEPFRLKLDTEQLSALAFYKVILIQTIEKRRYIVVSVLKTQSSSVVISVPDSYLHHSTRNTTCTYICVIE